MLQQQGVGRGGMLLDAKGCRLETLHRVTGSTLTFVSPFDELAIVLVPVAVEASLKYQRFFEIATGVALQAIHRLVLTRERVLGF